MPAGIGAADSSTQVCPYTSEVATSGTFTVSGSTITLTGVTLPAGWGCSFSIEVTGPVEPGNYVNATGHVNSADNVAGISAVATLNVLAPPSIAMAFHPAAITVGTQTALDFTVTNPATNAIGVTGVDVAASLPVGLVIVDGSSSVCGGTLTTSGGNSIGLSGAAVEIGSTCTFSVEVTGAVIGGYTTLGGTVGSANAGTGNAATASLVVSAPIVTPTPPSDPTASPSASAPPAASPTVAASPTASAKAAASLPPTSTAPSDGSGKSDPGLPLLLLVAFVTGSVIVRRAEIARR